MSSASRKSAVVRAAAKVQREKAVSRVEARQRAGEGVPPHPLEAVFDRVLANRLRPLRAELTASRKSYERQVSLRVDAETRAAKADELVSRQREAVAAAQDEAAQLRARIVELEYELTAIKQRKTGLFRRRLSEQPQG